MEKEKNILDFDTSTLGFSDRDGDGWRKRFIMIHSVNHQLFSPINKIKNKSLVI